VFGQILTELGKAIQDGRLKPVVIGPVEIPIPGQAGPAGQPQQAPGGDILGQILRDILSGAGGQVQVPRQALMNGAGAAVFGDRLEAGRDVEQSQIDSLQQLFNRFLAAQGR
jgi:hypothetical protein